jgi:drug/metabolite transporter (DMT)-like permease
VAVLLALAAALLFALGTVLQQRAAMREPEGGDGGSSTGLLLRLARKPVWLAGIAADALGFVAQAAALGVGRLVVVQPVLATSVVFALPLGAKLTGQRVGRREIVAALAVTGGLAAFLVLSNPSGGREDAPAAEWLVAGGACLVLSAALFIAARGRSPAMRATLLGTATGILFGLSAALTKAVVDQLDEGIVEVLENWHIYALALVGYASMTLSQLSLQTGVLAPAMATSMIFDPLASVVLGVTLLQEDLHQTTGGAIVSLIGLAAMVAGLVVLARTQAAPDETEIRVA